MDVVYVIVVTLLHYILNILYSFSFSYHFSLHFRLVLLLFFLITPVAGNGAGFSNVNILKRIICLYNNTSILYYYILSSIAEMLLTT